MGRGDSPAVVIQLLVVITIVRHFLPALKPQLKLWQVNYFHSSVCLPTQVYFEGTTFVLLDLVLYHLRHIVFQDFQCTEQLSLIVLKGL